MTLFANWIEGNKYILAGQAQAILNESWKKQTYECPECKEKLTPVKDCLKTNQEGEEYYVVTHFSHKPESTCKLALNESDEHKTKKALILSALFNGKIKLNVNATTITLNVNEIKGMEKSVLDNQADILIQFNQFNALLGLGIAIEIMETESIESIEEKKIKYTNKGYTIIPIAKERNINDLIKDGINCYSPFLTTLKKEVMEATKELKLTLERAKILPNLQQHSISSNSNSCLTCLHGSSNKTIKGELDQDSCCCWLWRNKGLQKTPDKMDNKHICNFFVLKVRA